MSITEFLLARIEEDEKVARAASGSTVEGRIGAWSAVPGGDEWEVGDEDFEVEILVALRPNLKRPPTPLDGKWGAITVWSDLEPGSDRNYIIPRARHIARQDPARVLAECAAKRAIIANTYQSQGLHADDVGFAYEDANYFDIRALAAVYKDHPDYRQEWAQ